ncbi:biotin--[acetyl-CoA-carboxylase] ligase, partial [Eubacterium pyruvativorans]
MSTKTELLKLLTDHTGEFVSGQQAGEYLGVSRNAVWKAVSKLKEEGYLIESRPNAGYRLTESDILRLESVLARVHRDCAVEVYDTVGSTNDVVKERPLSRKPLVVIANRQTGGRGRYGRRFESPAGTGLYITFGLTPDFAIDRALYVTMASAVATARAIQTVCGVETGIKWVNDLYYHDRKVCGILTEGQTNFETGRIDRLICGIGVNCFPGSFPEELRHKAGSLSAEKGSFSRNALAAEMINEFL